MKVCATSVVLATRARKIRVIRFIMLKVCKKMAAILERRAAISEIYFLSISFKANA